MIASKETLIVRLEIELEILVGELRILEDNTENLTVKKLVEVWAPEMKDARIMLKLKDLEEKL
jgi:hypothetical protein